MSNVGHDWADELAHMIAYHRNGNAVYMDGSHVRPRTSEQKAAREFVDRVRADERAKALVLHLHKMEEFDEALDAARADERERIAEAIEAKADDLDWDGAVATKGELAAVRDYAVGVLHDAAAIARDDT